MVAGCLAAAPAVRVLFGLWLLLTDGVSGVEAASTPLAPSAAAAPGIVSLRVCCAGGLRCRHVPVMVLSYVRCHFGRYSCVVWWWAGVVGGCRIYSARLFRPVLLQGVFTRQLRPQEEAAAALRPRRTPR